MFNTCLVRRHTQFPGPVCPTGARLPARAERVQAGDCSGTGEDTDTHATSSAGAIPDTVRKDRHAPGRRPDSLLPSRAAIIRRGGV